MSDFHKGTGSFFRHFFTDLEKGIEKRCLSPYSGKKVPVPVFRFPLTQSSNQMLTDQANRPFRLAVYTERDFGQAGVLKFPHALDFPVYLANSGCRNTTIDDFF